MARLTVFIVFLLYTMLLDTCTGYKISGEAELTEQRKWKLTEEFYQISASDDEVNDACSSEGGICQDDAKSCSGSYVNDQCSGNNIRCCLNRIVPQNTKECPNVLIYTRDTWGARRPKQIDPLNVPVTMFFIHHTEMGFCKDLKSCVKDMHIIQDFHMDDRGWLDIAYSFLIGGDGHVYEGRGWKREGAHTLHYDKSSLALSFIGNFDSILPTAAALSAAKQLLKCGVEKGYLTKDYSLYGHRDVRATDCPGDDLYNLIRSWPHYNTTTDGDGKCTVKHGLCRPNYFPCNGTYQSGLCSGYDRRQCCVPKTIIRM